MEAVWRAFKELVIDKALTIALKKQRLDVKDQVKTNIFFEGENVGVYVPDKVINDVVLVELSRAKIGVNFGFISKAQNISSVC
ncbi:MAG: hypothetical protein KBD66_03175 [Candidatus Doudnabacteria bacterium]|nr:hypothetical protein [Candidatus Doudnabacteria bacterium]